MHDRQQVLRELALGRLLLVIENHELDPLPLEEPLDELESEAAEAVAVGNGNRAYSSLQRSFQNGFKPLALEVEPAADVRDDLCARAPLAHVRDLPLEVGLLAGRGHATVGDCDAGVRDSGGGGSAQGEASLSRLGVHGRCGCSDGVHGLRGEEGVDIVEPRSSRSAERRDASLSVPLPQSSDADPKPSCRSTAFHQDHPQHP